MARGTVTALACCALLAACAGAERAPPHSPPPPPPPPDDNPRKFYPGDGLPEEEVDVAAIPDAVPVAEPRSANGNRPYAAFGKTYVPLQSARGFRQRGTASWYGRGFHGRRTASGERYDMFAMTAAHPTLPLPTFVRVRNIGNGLSVVVKVNDRGPFLRGRVIDLSFAAAKKLRMAAAGTAEVEVTAVFAAGDAMEKENPGDAAEPQWFVQAGAFASEDRARQLALHLRRNGVLAVAVTRMEKDGAKLYRVRAGPIQNGENAERVLRQVLPLAAGARLVGI
ncbi:MAG: septal ring lytic transglycosylase RlpA family protein [Gammaproteobacteria bacterium]|nr:septal ring lytic transglycosylase RlpA family protein [Gammaproteobacteria bacterium]